MNNKERGYTLLEMCLVTAVFLVLAGILYPVGMQGLQEIALRSATQAFVGELLRARLLALSENAAVAVRVAQETNSYQLFSSADRSCERGSEKNLGSRVSFVQVPAREVVFHPWGTAAPAGSYTLAGSGGRMTVVVGLTGRVRFERVKP